MLNCISKISIYLILPLMAIPILVIEAQAYLDPGTGSQLFQLLLASLLGALFTLKMYWKKFMHFLKNIFSKNDQEKDD